MTAEEFDKILSNRLVKTDATLSGKGKEYAHEGDRLWNFKRAAGIAGVDPKEALFGMMTKHLVSVHDLCTGRLENTKHMADEKVGDTINYLCLLEALLHEERTDAAYSMTVAGADE